MVRKFVLPKVQSDLGILSHGRRISITQSNKEQSVTLTATGISRRLQNTYFHLRSFVCEFFGTALAELQLSGSDIKIWTFASECERVFQVFFLNSSGNARISHTQIAGCDPEHSYDVMILRDRGGAGRRLGRSSTQTQ